MNQINYRKKLEVVYGFMNSYTKQTISWICIENNPFHEFVYKINNFMFSYTNSRICVQNIHIHEFAYKVSKFMNTYIMYTISPV